MFGFINKQKKIIEMIVIDWHSISSCDTFKPQKLV